jgi:hypothetical protein
MPDFGRQGQSIALQPALAIEIPSGATFTNASGISGNNSADRWSRVSQGFASHGTHTADAGVSVVLENETDIMSDLARRTLRPAPSPRGRRA